MGSDAIPRLTGCATLFRSIGSSGVSPMQARSPAALARDVSSMAPSEAPGAPAGSGRTPSSFTGSDRSGSPILPLLHPGKDHPGEGAWEGALARFTELMRPVFYWNVSHYKVSIKYWLF